MTSRAGYEVFIDDRLWHYEDLRNPAWRYDNARRLRPSFIVFLCEACIERSKITTFDFMRYDIRHAIEEKHQPIIALIHDDAGDYERYLGSYLKHFQEHIIHYSEATLNDALLQAMTYLPTPKHNTPPIVHYDAPPPKAIRAEFLYLEAHAAYQRMEIERALHLAEAALDHCREHQPMWTLTISILRSLNRLEEALSMSLNLEKIVPDDYKVFTQRGIIYGQMGRFDEALQALSRALRLAPSSGTVYNNRAMSRYQLGDFQGALDDVERALHFNPVQRFARATKGSILLSLGRYAEAEDSYMHQLEYYPDSAEARLGLAVLAYITGQHAHALHQMKPILDELPPYEDFDFACRSLGWVEPLVGLARPCWEDYHRFRDNM